MLKEITAPLLTTEWGQRLGFFLAILFGILLVSTFFTILSNILHDNTPKQNMPVVILKDQTMAFIKQIPERHLFGNAAETASILPIARLPFALIGVFESTSQNSSRAMISEAGETGKLFRIGDRLASGIKIAQITSDGIIVDNNNHLEKLPLQRTPLVFHEAPQKSF